MPQAEEEKLLLIACISGLLARVAYIDFDVHESELKSMHNLLAKWTHLDEEESKIAIDLAIEEIKDLADLESTHYCHPLNDILDNDQKYHILECLFTLAAADDNVEHKESEEIRVICQGLLLEHKHFIAARAGVKDKLSALKA